jgi:hypothetical protein
MYMYGYFWPTWPTWPTLQVAAIFRTKKVANIWPTLANIFVHAFDKHHSITTFAKILHCCMSKHVFRTIGACEP